MIIIQCLKKKLDLKLQYIGVEFEFNKNFQNLGNKDIETICKYYSNVVLQELIYKKELQELKSKYTNTMYSLETIEKDKKKDEIDYNILRLVNLEKVKILNNETKIKKYIIQ